MEDQPLVLWVLVLALFEDWSDIGLSPVLRHLSCPPGPLNNGEWLITLLEPFARL